MTESVSVGDTIEVTPAVPRPTSRQPIFIISGYTRYIGHLGKDGKLSWSTMLTQTNCDKRGTYASTRVPYCAINVPLVESVREQAARMRRSFRDLVVAIPALPKQEYWDLFRTMPESRLPQFLAAYCKHNAVPSVIASVTPTSSAGQNID